MSPSRPSDDGFAMPAEWAPHARCWMAWPCRTEVWRAGLVEVRRAYAEIAKAIAEFEPVTMLARPEHVAEASVLCSGRVQVMPLEIDDSWLRDNGPTFVADGAGRTAAVRWRFNAWGEKYRPFDRDARVPVHVAAHLGMRLYEAPMVLEGGSITVDGEGTLITTEQCLLNPNRNPSFGRQEIEAMLGAYLGVRQVIWLGQGLAEDETDGHVDNLACFVRPGVVLALCADDRSDPDYDALQDNLERLGGATDAAGRRLQVIQMPAPRRRDVEGRRLPLSYINIYIANGGIVVPIFEDANDDRALAIIADAFPDRRVVPAPGLDVVRGGGNVHCITQQQPEGTPVPAVPEDRPCDE